MTTAAAEPQTFDTTKPTAIPQTYWVRIIDPNRVINGAPNGKLGDLVKMGEQNTRDALLAGMVLPHPDMDSGPADVVLILKNRIAGEKQKAERAAYIQREREKLRTVLVEALQSNFLVIGKENPPFVGEKFYVTEKEAITFENNGQVRRLSPRVNDVEISVDSNVAYLGDLTKVSAKWRDMQVAPVEIPLPEM